jgi:hypothetical protein
MPWEGMEEKKQKLGTSNVRLAYVMHIHQSDYERIITLLAVAKEKGIWHKHWGNAAFTIETPNKRSSQGVRTKYIHMVQTTRKHSFGRSVA